ncbi:flagellar protein FlaG [Natranaerobius thermophilus]|uniref:Flagellar protein FlaG protein n=1 Tax=Natranaerobius thermophilus (strain ATCC BAA-1301 / DSM 18059 / JW/NM-WN-LF) TaxID=457570 RepID=B2A824_NATTJ|nr:flagellar protein FlaG [Natranaerobius thermophilus]ACB85796.1 flagellar protein FlaG protein [Natranaerobius thermophilus JW/NM-WN-LF]
MRVNETDAVSKVKGLDNLDRGGASGANKKLKSSNEVLENKLGQDQLAPEERREDLNQDKVKKALEEFEELNKFIDKGFDFHVHEKTDKIWVEVIDREQDEVIREIPPEKILDIIAGLKEVVGLIVDEEA